MLGLQRANIPCQLMVKLLSKNSNLCDHNSPTSQTDRQTDRERQMTCDRNTALCTKLHRAVKRYYLDLLGLEFTKRRSYSVLACCGIPPIGIAVNGHVIMPSRV